jgi:hypothetical protein
MLGDRGGRCPAAPVGIAEVRGDGRDQFQGVALGLELALGMQVQEPLR